MVCTVHLVISRRINEGGLRGPEHVAFMGYTCPRLRLEGVVGSGHLEFRDGRGEIILKWFIGDYCEDVSWTELTQVGTQRWTCVVWTP
jgi:hypothetical protein